MAFQQSGYWVDYERFPLKLTGTGSSSKSPFMYGENTRKLQNYLNSKYGAGLTPHGIFGNSAQSALQKHLGKSELSQSEFDALFVVKAEAPAPVEQKPVEPKIIVQRQSNTIFGVEKSLLILGLTIVFLTAFPVFIYWQAEKADY